MGLKTGYRVECRGCREGAIVPLLTIEKGPEQGRFYYNHNDRDCKHHERFPIDIDNVSDLGEMVPGLKLQGPAQSEPEPVQRSEPLTVETVAPEPETAPDTSADLPDFGHDDIVEDETPSPTRPKRKPRPKAKPKPKTKEKTSDAGTGFELDAAFR